MRIDENIGLAKVGPTQMGVWRKSVQVFSYFFEARVNVFPTLLKLGSAISLLFCFMTLSGAQWSLVKLDEAQWSLLMKQNEAQWSSAKLNEAQWSKEAPWSSVKFNEPQWSSMRRNEAQQSSIKLLSGERSELRLASEASPFSFKWSL